MNNNFIDNNNINDEDEELKRILEQSKFDY